MIAYARYKTIREFPINAISYCEKYYITILTKSTRKHSPKRRHLLFFSCALLEFRLPTEILSLFNVRFPILLSLLTDNNLATPGSNRSMLACLTKVGWLQYISIIYNANTAKLTIDCIMCSWESMCICGHSMSVFSLHHL